MPHLSPMNWMLMILFSWLCVLTITSMVWWNTDILFSSLVKKDNSSNMAQWLWSLQDGWALKQ